MRIAIVVLLIAFCSTTQAQVGNEWVDYGRQYWRFPVSETGMHRIGYDELLSSGFPVTQVNPASVRIFGRGEEQFIRVQDGGDNSLDPGDFIEVWAKKNDGWLDASIYDEPQHQVNSQYSLFNDTANYFLTFSAGNGLRTETYLPQNDPDDLQFLPYVEYSYRENYTEEYLVGKQDINGISLPWYEEAEGWFDSRFAIGQTRSKSIEHPFAYIDSGAPVAKFTATSASASLAAGFVNHHLQVGYGNPFQLVADTIYYGYQFNQFQWDVAANALGSGVTTVTHRSIDDLGVATDWHAVGWIQVDYARIANFTANVEKFQALNLFTQVEGKLEIQTSLPNPRLFESGNGLLREFNLEGIESGYETVVSFLTDVNQTELILVDAANVIDVGNLQPVSNTGYFTDYTENPLDSAFVIITAPQLLSAASNYSFYRESQGMDVLLVNIEELYMQYGGGIWKHPLSIRNFCNDLLQSWESEPSHLFIIGKSIFEMKISATVGARDNLTNYANNFVPSWGYPTSDLALTSGLNGTLSEVAIPTGRLSARNQEDVLDYLNKVVEFESQEPAPWMKRIIHFGGGANQFEQSLFAGFLNSYRNIAQDTCFGGSVSSFFKTTTDPIQLNLSDSIAFLITDGVSLMTFFGHASSTGFDVNIDAPSNYNNQGRYPLLIGNSCYTGNIHLPTSFSTSEEFVLVPEAGVIGFIAKADLGAPAYLNIWTENFYLQTFQANYGGSIGQNMKRAVQEFQSETQNLITENTALTFSLHGDPAIVLNAFAKPDYSISVDDLVFAPNNITSELESFQVKVAVTNIGKAINAPFGVELVRHLPSGQDTSIVIELDNLYFRDTVTFNLPVDALNGVGLNTFDVLVDFPANQVDELEDLQNNTVYGKELFITSGNLIPVYPFNFAIEPFGNITLKASTGDPLAATQNYLFELDTTDQFNSPSLLTTQLIHSGGIVEWELLNELENERVYYWRTAASPDLGQDPMWRLHSFQYLEGERGFGQAHFEQFRNNTFAQIVFDDDQNNFDFVTGDVNLKCTVYGHPSNTFEINATRYQLDLDVMDYAGCGSQSALHVAVIDPITLAPWESNYDNEFPENDFGNLMDCANGRERPEKYFIFRQNNSTELAGMVDMLENAVPDGHYILIYTWKHVNYDGWDENAPEVYDLFNNLGATQIGNAPDSVPFIFFAEKGNLGSALEVYGTTQDQLVELETTLTGSLGVGKIISPLFGPVSEWEALYWDIESEGADSTRVKVFGVTAEGAEPLMNDLPATDNEWQELGFVVDANVHSRIRLVSDYFDLQDQTPSQINRWQLISDHAPECALNANKGFFFPKDTVQQGEPLSFAIAIENIGDFHMDSLLVSYSISFASGTATVVEYERQDSLMIGEILLDTLQISTTLFSGDLVLKVEVNPRNAAGVSDQLEQHHFNNIAELRFHVNDDQINPLLDVTFDGQHILNGDIVSAAPYIRIALDDENTFILMNEPSDTAQFKVFVTHPDQSQRPVYFSQVNIINFFPATSSANRCYIEYRPLFDADGAYQLLVQAQDKSGNASGDLDYRIDFEIYAKPSITEVLNYPNPFSTRTQFVFTLTGVEAPDEVLIRIMTISGRVVREIRSDEIGPLQIGRNQTDFWWDGTDEFGDRLANGIYLYTVQARLHGQSIDLSTTAASPFFKNGIGKMYLLR
ncbi:MAG: hypothetical protein ACI923_002427 [Flavobacteriales bacterium]|jgi:hypothetical protein